MKHFIIGLGHRSKVGKDTTALMIKKVLAELSPELTVKIMPLAWAVKSIAHLLYSWAGLREAMYYEERRDARYIPLPIIGLTPVEIWIRLGTPAIREQVYEDTWVKFLLHNIDLSPPGVIIIPDVRFPNEAKAIKEKNGRLVKIDNIKVKWDEKLKADFYMLDYTGWDYLINNDGTLEELEAKTRTLLNTFAKEIQIEHE